MLGGGAALDEHAGCSDRPVEGRGICVDAARTEADRSRSGDAAEKVAKIAWRREVLILFDGGHELDTVSRCERGEHVVDEPLRGGRSRRHADDTVEIGGELVGAVDPDDPRAPCRRSDVSE